MEISGEQAFDLLRKWYTERTPVIGMLVPANSSAIAKVNGFVDGLSVDILISGNPMVEKVLDGPKYSYLLFPSGEAQSFHYGELKDMPFSEEEKATLLKQHGLANLSIRLADGTRISIFEVDTI